ncbi:CE1 family esterase [Roseivivax sp. CAU 1753]
MARRGSSGGTGTSATPKPRAVRIKTRYGKRDLCLPPLARVGAPAASLILGFHGGNGTARAFAERSGLCGAIHSFGHDIAFPQALKHWSDGRPPLEPGWPADRSFVEALHAASREALGLDTVPLALIGSSNGAMFAQRYAIEARDKPVITVAVASALPEAVATGATLGAPTPVMLIQGEADPIIPWKGGEVLDIGGMTVKGRLLSVDDTVAFWQRHNRVSGAPRQQRFRIGGKSANVHYWAGGPDGADVWLVIIEGGGHRLLDGDPRPFLPGTLEEFIARTVLWYVDPERLSAAVDAE